MMTRDYHDWRDYLDLEFVRIIKLDQAIEKKGSNDSTFLESFIHLKYGRSVAPSLDSVCYSTPSWVLEEFWMLYRVLLVFKLYFQTNKYRILPSKFEKIINI